MLLVATAALASGAPMPPTPTTTRITSPAAVVHRLDDRSRPASARPLGVRGRSDGRRGGTVDLRCVAGGRTATVRRAVPLSPDGSFRTRISLPRVPAGGCDLRAVPPDVASAIGERFRGPRLVVTRYVEGAQLPVAGGEGIGTDRFRVTTAGATVAAPERGVDLLGGWRGAGRVSAVAGDGAPVVLPAAVPTVRGAAPRGFSGVDSYVDLTPRSGRATVTSTSPLMRCRPSRAGAGDCPSLDDAGVRLERTVEVAGDVVDVRDRWISTDRRAHRLRATVAWPATISSPLWSFPDGAPAGSLPSSIVLGRPGTLVATGGSGAAALGLEPLPASVAAGDAATVIEALDLAIPAGGAVAQHRVLTVAADPDRAAAMAAVAPDPADAPRVTILAPLDRTATHAAATTVRGTIEDPDGIARLRIAGRATAVAADGSFAAKVPLHTGTNLITVAATDRRGTTGAAQLSVGQILVADRRSGPGRR